MPASHAGDHRSEAGQGRQFLGAWFTGNSRPTWLRTSVAVEPALRQVS